MTKDVTKEDSQPKYTEIAYQLLKTFAGQHANSGKQHNKQLNSAFIIPPDYWQVFASGFHAINTSDQEARSLYRQLNTLPPYYYQLLVLLYCTRKMLKPCRGEPENYVNLIII